MYVRAQGGLAQFEDANWLKSYYIFKEVLCREMHWKWNVLGSASIIFFFFKVSVSVSYDSRHIGMVQSPRRAISSTVS